MDRAMPLLRLSPTGRFRARRAEICFRAGSQSPVMAHPEPSGGSYFDVLIASRGEAVRPQFECVAALSFTFWLRLSTAACLPLVCSPRVDSAACIVWGDYEACCHFGVDRVHLGAERM